MAGQGPTSTRVGKHTRYLPKSLQERYDAAARDPDLVDLRDEIALLDVRIGQLLETLGDTGSPRLWREARARFDAFKAAGTQGKGSVVAARAALQAVDDVLAEGLAASSTWEELRDTIELRRRLSEAQSRRRRDNPRGQSLSRALVWAGLDG
jgi:hypothetical protein